MEYNFDEIISREGTHSIKIDACKRNNPYLPDNAIPLWIADMDFASPEPVLAAMRARLDRRILGYTDMEGDAYNAAVTGWFSRRFGWEFSPETLVFSAGVVSALHLAVRLLTKPSDSVLLMTPAYHPFEDAAKCAGRGVLFSRLMDDGTGYYTVDWADFAEKAARPECSLFFLCSPQNPTGRVWTEEELRRIGEICFANQVFVVDDEIHCDLLRTGQTHIPFAKLFPHEKRLITCTSPSKTFNIAGNRHANLIIPDPALREKWTALGHGNPGALSTDGVIAAYDGCEDWLDQLRVYLDGNFQLLSDIFREKLPKAVFRIPEGTYLAWVNLAPLGVSEAVLNEAVSRGGVYVQFGKDFVDNGDCHMRINMASPRSVIREATNRICASLSKF